MEIRLEGWNPNNRKRGKGMTIQPHTRRVREERWAALASKGDETRRNSFPTAEVTMFK